uniref:Hemagglutinin-like protein n=1 Tax=Ganoderma boninense TaxID=34458 RepID=A0A5K1K2K0_9APHY|nr:Hemagglutinin-like protein [Ganoderma boninense]
MQSPLQPGDLRKPSFSFFDSGFPANAPPTRSRAPSPSPSPSPSPTRGRTVPSESTATPQSREPDLAAAQSAAPLALGHAKLSRSDPHELHLAPIPSRPVLREVAVLYSEESDGHRRAPQLDSSSLRQKTRIAARDAAFARARVRVVCTLQRG